jgi:uncharacterized repeat protein (TIGR02059 family)
VPAPVNGSLKVPKKKPRSAARKKAVQPVEPVDVKAPDESPAQAKEKPSKRALDAAEEAEGSASQAATPTTPPSTQAGSSSDASQAASSDSAATPGNTPTPASAAPANTSLNVMSRASSSMNAPDYVANMLGAAPLGAVATGGVLLALAAGGSRSASGTSSADTTAPVLQSASTSSDGKKIILSYDETLSTSLPAASTYVVSADGTTIAISSVARGSDGKSMELTLASAITSLKTVTLSYTPPAAQLLGTADISLSTKDSAGNRAASLSNQAVTVNDGVAPVQTAISAVTLDGVSRIIVTYSETLLSSKPPEAANYTVNRDGILNPVTGVEIIGSTVRLTLRDTLLASNTNSITVAYQLPANTGSSTATNLAVQDISGNDAASFTAQSVSSVQFNPVAPVFKTAATNTLGNQVTLTFDSELDAARLPSAAAFEVQLTEGSSSRLVAVDSLTVSGSTVTLTLHERLQTATAGIRVRYTDPSSSDDTLALQNLAGNDVASIGLQAVNNNIDAALPTLSSLTAKDASTLVLTFSKTLASSTAASSAFAVKTGGLANAVTAVKVSGSTLELSLSRPLAANEASELSYTAPVANLASGNAAIEDLVGHDVASFSTTAADLTAPTLVSAATNAVGTQVVLTFSEAMLTTNLAAASAFTVAGSVTGSVAVSSLVAAGSTVTLTLASALKVNDALSLVYNAPTATVGTANSALQDLAGNDLASLGQSAVVSVANKVAPSFASSTLDAGASTGVSALTLNFNDQLDTSVLPPVSAFSVTAGGSSQTVTAVQINGSAVTLLLAAPVTQNGVNLLVAYTAPTSDGLVSSVGTPVGGFAATAVGSVRNGNGSGATLTGTSSSEYLLVDASNLTLSGAAGADTFFYPSAVASGLTSTSVLAQSLTDFGLTQGSGSLQGKAEADTLDLRQLLSGFTAASIASYLQAADDGTASHNLVLNIDHNGGGSFARTMALTFKNISVNTSTGELSVNGATMKATAAGLSGNLTLSNVLAQLMADGKLITADIAPPALVSTSFLSDKALLLTFSEPLGASTAAGAAFTLTSGGTVNPVTSVTVNGNTLTLSLTNAVSTGAATTLRYSAPASNAANTNAAVQDVTGNDLPSFSARLDTTAPTLLETGSSIKLKDISSNSNGSQLSLNFSETLLGSNLPPASAFTVSGGHSVSAVTVSGSNVVLTLSPPASAGEDLTLYYTAPTASIGTGNAALQDLSGNDLLSLGSSAAPLAVVSKVLPLLSSQTLSLGTQPGFSQITLNFDDALDPAFSPPTSAFTASVNGLPKTISAVQLNGRQVILVLDSAITSSASVSLNYTGSSLRDSTGNRVSAFNSSSLGSVLAASSGSDTLTGTSDVNYFLGSLGNDTLTGGGGLDSFAWPALSAPGNMVQTLTDFGFKGASGTRQGSADADVLDLQALLSGFSEPSLAQFVQFDKDANGLLRLRIDRDGGSSFAPDAALVFSNVNVDSADQLLINGATVAATASGLSGKLTLANVMTQLRADAQLQLAESRPPQLSGVSFKDSRTLVIAFDEELAASTALPAAFSVSTGTVANPVTSVAVSGKRVELSLTRALVSGESASVSYTAAASNSATGNAAMEDKLGNDAASIPVTTVDTSAPTLASVASNKEGTQIVLTFNEDMLSSALPEASRFAVAGHTITGVSASGKTLLLIMGEKISAAETLSLVYTAPAAEIGTANAAMQDLAGNDALSIGTAAAPRSVSNAVDGVAPSLVSSRAYTSATATRVVLTYSEDLLASKPPTSSAYTVSVAGTNNPVTQVEIVGKEVRLTLQNKLASLNGSLAVAYTAPSVDSGPGNAAVQDSTGNDAAAISSAVAIPLSSHTFDAVLPTLTSTQTNTLGTQITLNFSEALDSVATVAASAFQVQLTDAGVTSTVDIASLSLSGSTLVLNLKDRLISSTASIKVSYTDPSAGDDLIALQDTAGNDLASVSALTVSNTIDAIAPIVSSLSLKNNQTLVVAFSEALGAVTAAASAFNVTSAGSSNAVTSVRVVGSALELSLSRVINPGDATSLSYTAPGADLSAINLAVQDNAGIDAASFSNQTLDTTAPTLVGAASNASGSQVVLTFSENMLDSNFPATNALVVVGATAHSVNSYVTSGRTITLNLSTPILASEVVTLQYNAPTITMGTGNAAFQDSAGNDVASIGSTTPVGVANTVPPALSAKVLSSSSAGADLSQITLTFDDELVNSPAVLTQLASAFSVSAGGNAQSISSVSIGSGATSKLVTLTLAGGITTDNALVTLSYTAPASDGLQDSSGNKVASFNGLNGTSVLTLGTVQTGDAGADSQTGSTGIDYFLITTGDDVLTGAGGADHFVWPTIANPANFTQTVKDFGFKNGSGSLQGSSEADVLDLRHFLDGFTSNSSLGDFVRLSKDGSGKLLLDIDHNGGGSFVADAHLMFDNTTVNASDLVLINGLSIGSLSNLLAQMQADSQLRVL